MAATADWLHVITGELFEAGLPWCSGARELLDALHDAAVPMALVTNTRRGLTERALNSIGRHYFTASVCGDEGARAKPPRSLPARRAARPTARGLSGDRGLGDRRGLRRRRWMPGSGGAQRHRGPGQPSPPPRHLAGRRRPRPPPGHLRRPATRSGTHRLTCGVLGGSG